MPTEAALHLCKSVFICGSLLQQLTDESGESTTEAVVLHGVLADDGGAAEAKEFNCLRAGQGSGAFAHGLGGTAVGTVEFRRLELVELPAHGQRVAMTRRMSLRTSTGVWVALMSWTMFGP